MSPLDSRPAVMAVDDLPQNVRLLDAVLSPRGYRVIGVRSGQEALHRMAADPPDLVLLDVLMPGIDGFEVCRRIRRDPATAFLPVAPIPVAAAG